MKLFTPQDPTVVSLAIHMEEHGDLEMIKEVQNLYRQRDVADRVLVVCGTLIGQLKTGRFEDYTIIAESKILKDVTQ